MYALKRILAVAVVAAITTMAAVPAAKGAGPQATPAATDNSGIDLAGMDHSIKSGDDFFSYTNGTWVKNTQIRRIAPAPGRPRIWRS
jgi:putative endopeptidase